MNRRDFLFKSGAAVSMGIFAPALLRGQPVPAPENLGPGSGGPRPQHLLTPPGALQVQPPALVTEFHVLRREVGFFTGRGGTIGWLASPEALVAVDTQFPNTAEVFLKGMPGRGERRLDAVINTHHHGDHTGGNGIFKPWTKTIVAHSNVPDLMLAAAKLNPGAPTPTLPTETFPEVWHREVGGESITARYYHPAHTSGDIVVYFEKANVVHVGDLVFNRIYPVIDRAGGGRFKSWITTLEAVVKNYPADAIYIYGHGSQKFGVTGGRADILAFRDYVAALLAHVENEIKAGTTKEKLIELSNLPGFPDLHLPRGAGNRFAGNLEVAYDELTSSS